MPDIDYAMLTKEILSQLPKVGLKDVPSSTPTTVYGHGYGGLFSYPGLSRPVFNAMVLPQKSLQAMLPVRASREQTPLFGLFTGVTDTSGSEPTGVCDDPPVAGLSKLCMHSFVFGRQSRMSRVFEIDRMGLIVNRSDNTDLQFMGNPFQGGTMQNVPAFPGFAGASNNVLNTELGKAFFEMGVAWSRDFAREAYTGNPTNNTAGGGRKYFYGLDILINTGYRDAESGIACPAADSIVRSMGSLEINTNGTTYVRHITNILRNLKHLSSRVGLDPVQWVISMPWAMFYELSEIWPCAYATYRCQSGYFSESQAQSVDTQWMIDFRDDMRNGEYLLCDGKKIPVVLDDSVTETPLAGSSFSAPMYFVPLTVLGGTPVTYLEHVDYDMPGGAMESARAMAPADSYFSSDGGRFLWHKKPPNNFCVQYLGKTEPRIMLLTPHIAARLTNCKYTPVAHERDWDPDGSFYVDGGRTTRDIYGPSFYSPTS